MIDEVLIIKEVEKLLRDDSSAVTFSIKEIRNRIAKVLGDEVHQFKDEIKAIVRSFVLTQHLDQHDSLVNYNKYDGKDDIDDDDDDDDDVDKIVYDINDKKGSVAAPWESNYGKVVWVKIYSSFPWWPSIVNDPSSLPIKLKKQAMRLIGKKFCISYLGDATYGFPNLSQIRDFDEYYEEFSKQPSKKKADDDKLQDAIKLALEYKENIQFVKNEPPLKKLKTETSSPKHSMSTENKVEKSPIDKSSRKSPSSASKKKSSKQETKVNKPKELVKDVIVNGNLNNVITPIKKKKVESQDRKEEKEETVEKESGSEVEDDVEEDDEDYLSDKQSKRPVVKKVSADNDKAKKRKRDSSESIKKEKNDVEVLQPTGNSTKKRTSTSTSIGKSVEGGTSSSSAKKLKPSIEKEKTISTPGENKKKKSEKPNLTIEKPLAKSNHSTSTGKVLSTDKKDKVETPLALATRLVSLLEDALTSVASAKENIDKVLRILDKLKHVKLSLSELQESRALEIVIGLRKHSISEIALQAKNLRNYWKQQMVSAVVSTPKSTESMEIEKKKRSPWRVDQ